MEEISRAHRGGPEVAGHHGGSRRGHHSCHVSRRGGCCSGVRKIEHRCSLVS
jgi:hypothetical protein